MLPNIALYGRSGSGKTTVAEYLVFKYGYHHARTGLACRHICQLLFGSESKTLLNQVADALMTIDKNVWLRAALLNASEPIILDSVRFLDEYEYLKQRGFLIWRIDASFEERIKRLGDRGQEFAPLIDDSHPGEVELENSEFDFRILNNGRDLQALHDFIDQTVSSIKIHVPYSKC